MGFDRDPRVIPGTLRGGGGGGGRGWGLITIIIGKQEGKNLKVNKVCKVPVSYSLICNLPPLCYTDGGELMDESLVSTRDVS